MVHLLGRELQIDGTVRVGHRPDTSNDEARALLNAVADVLVTGDIDSTGSINVAAGVGSDWTLEQLTGDFDRTLLAADADILIAGNDISGNAEIVAQTEVQLLAGRDVRMQAEAELTGTQTRLPAPFITQEVTTVQVPTGTRLVEDGFTTVEEINWVPSTETVQVGTERVNVGREWYSFDVRLTQDGYHNGVTKREYFIEEVDYRNEAINWGSVSRPANALEFGALTDSQRQVVLNHLGYKPLYDFTASRIKRHTEIDGVSREVARLAPWADAPEVIRNLSLPGWNDKYIRLPLNAVSFVGSVVPIGESIRLPDEAVAQFVDSAEINYFQDKISRQSVDSRDPTNPRRGEWVEINPRYEDRLGERWAVSFLSGTGKRTFTDLSDGSTTVRSQVPVWVGDQLVVDPNFRGRHVFAPSGLLSDTDRLEPLPPSNPDGVAPRIVAGRDYRSDVQTDYLVFPGDFTWAEAVKFAPTVAEIEGVCPDDRECWTEIATPDGFGYEDIRSQSFDAGVTRITFIAGRDIATEIESLTISEWLHEQGQSGRFWLGGTIEGTDTSTISWQNDEGVSSNISSTLWNVGEPSGDRCGGACAIEMRNVDGVWGWNDLRPNRDRGLLVERNMWLTTVLQPELSSFRFAWTSNPHSVLDSRSAFAYRVTSADTPVFDNRPVFETFDTLVKDVSERQITRWRTETITQPQTVFSTKRVRELGDEPYAASGFERGSIQTAGPVRVQAANDVIITGTIDSRLDSISLDAGNDFRLAGDQAESDGPASVNHAQAELQAFGSISVAADGDLTISQGIVRADRGEDANTQSTLTLAAGGIVDVAGELFASDAATITAGTDVELEGATLALDRIEIRAGTVDSTGHIRGTLHTEISALDEEATIELTAGELAGDIVLLGSDINAPTGSVSLNTLSGGVSHTGGQIASRRLTVHSRDGLIANARVEELDTELTGSQIARTIRGLVVDADGNFVPGNLPLDGGLQLTNAQGLELVDVTTQDGDFRVTTFGDLLATSVRLFGSSEDDQAVLTSHPGSDEGHITLGDVRGDQAIDWTLRAAGDLAMGTSPLLAQHLLVIADTIALSTEADSLELTASDTGAVTVEEVDDLHLTDIEVLDGPITVTAGGDILVERLLSHTHNGTNHVFIESTGGDIEIGHINAGLYAATAAEANRLRAQRGGEPLQSLNNITLQSGGTIREYGPGDADVDLIAKDLRLTADSGIVGLELAASRITAVTSNTGTIELTDMSGIDEVFSGLEIVHAETAGPVTIVADGDVEISRITATGADGRVNITARNGNIVVNESSTNDDAIRSSSEISLVAAEVLHLQSNASAPRRLELRSQDGPLLVRPQALDRPQVYVSETVILESAESITIDRELRASERLEIISGGNVVVTPDSSNRPLGGQPVREVLITAAGNIEIHGSNNIQATDLLQLNAAGQLINVDLDFTLTGAQSTVDITARELRVNPRRAIRASDRISLTTTSGDLTMAGTLAGPDNRRTHVESVSLTSARDLSCQGTILAEGSISLNARGSISNSASCSSQVVLGGLAFGDSNADGIQAVAEPPMEGIQVRLLDSNDLEVATTVTTADGRYEFQQEDAGSYRVLFEPPDGFVLSLANQGDDDTLDSDPERVSRRTELIALGPGELNRSVDAGFVPAARIGDRVFRDANANGLQDTDEEGESGVIVRLLKPGNTSSIGTTVSDAEGIYDFPNLIPGDYLLRFELPDDFVFSLPDQGSDDTVDSDVDSLSGMTEVVSVASGEFLETMDAGLIPAASLGDTVFDDFHVDGIHDVTEVGLAGATVHLLSADEAQIATTLTDSAGRYLFAQLRPGDYRLRFELPPGLFPSPQNAGDDDTLDSDADPTTGLTHVVSLSPGEVNRTLDAGFFSNEAPVITAHSSSAPIEDDDFRPAQIGDVVSIMGTFEDDRIGGHQVVVDWDDGSQPEAIDVTLADPTGTFSGEHTYELGGIYHMRVTLDDGLGGVEVGTTTIGVTGIALRDGIIEIVGSTGNDLVNVHRSDTEQLVLARLPDGGRQPSIVIPGGSRPDLTGRPGITRQTSIAFPADEVQGYRITTGDGQDRVHVAASVNLPVVVTGGAGMDDIRGGAGADWLDGGAGDDRLHGGAGDDVLLGKDGDDMIAGDEGDDLLRGGHGNDFLLDQNGNDILLGEEGDDRFAETVGQNFLIGGSGFDSFSENADLNKDLRVAGTTAFDEDDTALMMILAEWSSPRGLAARILNLTGGNGERLNGDFFLIDGETVFVDEAAESLEFGMGGK